MIGVIVANAGANLTVAEGDVLDKDAVAQFRMVRRGAEVAGLVEPGLHFQYVSLGRLQDGVEPADDGEWRARDKTG